MIACLRKSNRLDKAEPVVEAAYSMNYWNLFTRDLLMEVENGTKWHKYFELEEVMICKVQNMYRGYLARKDFLRRIKQVMKEEEEEAAWEEEQQKDPELLAKNVIIQEKAAALLSSNLRSRFITWKIYVKDRKQERINCAIVIQKYARRYLGLMSYNALTLRTRRANQKILIVREHQLDIRKLRFMRVWVSTWEDNIKNRAINMIKDSIFIYVRTKTFLDAMTLVANIVRIQRRRSNRIVFRKWQKRYDERVRNHARITIRFFIRDVYIRMWEREREEAMKVKKADIMVKFKPNYRSVYRKFFFLWRDVYNNVLNNRAAGVIAVSFKRRIAINQDRIVYSKFRLLKEYSSKIHLKSIHHKNKKAIAYWRRNALAQKIQRAFMA